MPTASAVCQSKFLVEKKGISWLCTCVDHVWRCGGGGGGGVCVCVCVCVCGSGSGRGYDY